MSVAIWPETLPPPKRSGYREQYRDPRRPKSGDTGPPGWRLGAPAAGRDVAMTLGLHRALLGDFERFFEDDTQYGSLPFRMPAPSSDGWSLLNQDGAPLLTPDGTPLLLAANWLCLFAKDPPVIVPAGVRFNLSFAVVVLP